MLRRFSTEDGWLAGVTEAVSFAARWHADQRRPAGEPYVEHLQEATAFLALGADVQDVDVLQAAVLHDVVEDTPCTLAEVRAQSTCDSTSAGFWTVPTWSPRTGHRASFVSLRSDDGMPIEQISRLVGHSGTSVTELVYRKQIRPVVEHGAVAMDRILRADTA
jgi:hypothetical protein